MLYGLALTIAIRSLTIEQKSYEATVDESRLFAHAQQLLDWAYSTKDRNRNINTYGHNKTVDYLYNTLSSLGYYHVEKQPFRTGLTVGNSSLTVNGSPVIPADLFDYTGSGNVTAPMVVVDNLGCNLVGDPKYVPTGASADDAPCIDRLSSQYHWQYCFNPTWNVQPGPEVCLCRRSWRCRMCNMERYRRIFGEPHICNAVAT